MATNADINEPISLTSIWAGLGAGAQIKLDAYSGLVMEYRSAARLTGVKTKEDAHKVLVMESLALVPFLDKGAGDIADLGSGAGVPGIPLAAAFPETCFTFYERSAKKAGFLQIACNQLGLGNVTIEAKDPLAMSPFPKHSRLVTRSALPMEKLLGAAVKLLDAGGEMLGFLTDGRTSAFKEAMLPGYRLLELKQYQGASRKGYVYRLLLENLD
jgi:16S rRNA (guanine(527)-N(7))-methyltransferase RsmG